LLRTLAQGLARLPLALVHGLGTALGLAVYALAPGYRDKLAASLSVAGLNNPRMRRRAAAQAGRFACELPWIWLRPPSEVLRHVAPADWSAVDAVRASGRGVLLLTPHLGSFEIAARARAAISPITVLYKPARQAALRALVETARTSPNLSTAPANLAGVRTLLRALRRGEVVGLLPDQVPDAGEGEWTPFFGRPAYTMTLPGRLASAGQAAVFLVVVERCARARGWRIHVEALRDAPTPARLNAAMEALVRRFPEQYLWAYNRFKRPPGAPPAPECDAP